MPAFDIFLYAVAILAVLLFIGEPREAAPIAAPVADDLPTLGELLEVAEAATARPVPAIAAEVASTVAIAIVEVQPVADALAAMTSQQLRRECQRQGIAWRNAHGAGRHLRKEEMLKALA